MRERFEVDQSNTFGKIIPLSEPSLVQESFDLGQYKKLASIVRLQQAGLPTLPGFVIETLSDQTLVKIENWLEQTKARRLSIRFDSPNPEDNKKLMGANPTMEDLIGMKHLIKPPVVGIILGENDRFKQGPSVLTYFLEETMTCEVVGEGFDAADLTRGHISPHEIFILGKTTEDCPYPEIRPLHVLLHTVVDQAVYDTSRNLRYATISAILKKGLGQKVIPSKTLASHEIREVDSFLSERGAVLPTTYEPLGYDRLQNLYEHLSRLYTFSDYFEKRYNLKIQGRTLSSSFLRKYGLVFWDVYGADKYRRFGV